MTVEVKAGARYRSAVDDTEIIVVRGGEEELDLRCGGHPVVPVTDEPPGGLTIEAGFDAGTMIGKRYTDESGALEVLCTKSGQGTLTVGDTPLQIKAAKPLPSSD